MFDCGPSKRQQKSVLIIFFSVLKHPIIYFEVFFLHLSQEAWNLKIFTSKNLKKRKSINSGHTIYEFLDFTFLWNRCVAFHLLGNSPLVVWGICLCFRTSKSILPEIKWQKNQHHRQAPVTVQPQIYAVNNQLELDFAAGFLYPPQQQAVKASLKPTWQFNLIYRD